MSNLTDTDKRAIEILRKHGGEIDTNASGIGFLIYPDGGKHRWPQGLALCGMKVMRRLESKGLVKVRISRDGFGHVFTLAN